MNRAKKPLLIVLLTSVLLLTTLGIAQARRARKGGDETYYDFVACTDGLIAQLAYGLPTSNWPQPNPATLTGTSLLDNTPILNLTMPLDDGPVTIIDSSGDPVELDYSGVMTPTWSTSLLPGSRVALDLVMDPPVQVQNPFYLTVQDCSLSTPPADRDSLITQVLNAGLPFPIDDPNTPFCAPADIITSTIELTTTQDPLLLRPISDINVAMYLKSSSLPVVDLRARLTSPDATTVQLFDSVGGGGTNFGSRGTWEQGDLVGDPMADFVLDDSSDFHFSHVLPTVCQTANLGIPDNDPAGITDPFNLSDDGALTDLNVVISTTHTWVGDLSYLLEHGDTGTSGTIINRPGFPASTFGCPEDNIDVTIDDEAVNPVETQCSPLWPAIAGRFIGGDPPDNSLLAAFDGEDLSGTWNLTVADNAPGDTGTLVAWCLDPTVALGGIDPALTVSAPFTRTAVHPDEPLSNFNGKSAVGTWTLEICNRSDDSNQTGTLETWFLEVEVINLTSGVSLSADQSGSGLVGSTVTYTVNITNTGTLFDTFDLSTAGAWTTTSSINNISLAVGESGSFEVMVAIPSNVPNGAMDTATVTASGQGAPPATAESMLTTTAIGGEFDAYIYLPLVIKPPE